MKIFIVFVEDYLSLGTLGYRCKLCIKERKRYGFIFSGFFKDTNGSAEEPSDSADSTVNILFVVSYHLPGGNNVVRSTNNFICVGNGENQELAYC